MDMILLNKKSLNYWLFILFDPIKRKAYYIDIIYAYKKAKAMAVARKLRSIYINSSINTPGINYIIKIPD
jgi:hypothetical protein